MEPWALDLVRLLAGPDFDRHYRREYNREYARATERWRKNNGLGVHGHAVKHRKPERRRYTPDDPCLMVVRAGVIDPIPRAFGKVVKDDPPGWFDDAVRALEDG